MAAMIDDVTIDRLPPRFAETINPRAALGLIVLATDRAAHGDFLAFTEGAAGVATHAARIPFEPVATPQTLAGMGAHLEAGARLLVPGQPLGAIAYSCTSGTIAIGEDRVAAEIGKARPGVPVVTPIGAALDALSRFRARRISLLMPYLMDTAQMVARVFQGAGLTLDRAATFDTGGDPEMNRIAPQAIIDAALQVCAPESDALFISCTGMQTHAVIETIEERLGKPVLTSNQVLAWGTLRAAGINDPLGGRGRLFSECEERP